MTENLFPRSRTIWLICLAAIAIVLFHALDSLWDPAAMLEADDSDDRLRVLEVRAWLAGQSWFDTTQYRVLPPEGISLHWSRYVDAGIAFFLIPASWILPPDQAELAALALWPVFLSCLLVLLLVHGTARIFGPAGAIGALAVFFGWIKLGGEFLPGRVDHHNVQILAATAVFYLAVLPGPGRSRGALAGLTTAFALAIGLEMLPILALLWCFVLLRQAFDHPGAGDWLVGFCLSLAVAAPLLFAGQIPVSDWGIPRCDVLALPVFALAAVGIATSFAAVLSARSVKGPIFRILLMVAVAGIGLWLASPLLSLCAKGPYALASPAVSAIIEATVTDARPAFRFMMENPLWSVRMLSSPFVISLLALIAFLRWRQHLAPAQARAVIEALCLVLLGIGFAFYQVRAINLAAPALPLLAGFLVYLFTLIPRTSRHRLPAVLILFLAMPIVAERVCEFFTKPSSTSGQSATAVQSPASATPEFLAAKETHCVTADSVRGLSEIPQTVIFSKFLIGSAILIHTNHSVTSAGYHRSLDAFWNGTGAFQDITTLRKALEKSGAEYLVLCAADGEDTRFPYFLDGARPGWLVDKTGGNPYLRIFKLDRKAMLAEETP